nr:N-acetyltransferase [Streptomyces sp. SID1034]
MGESGFIQTETAPRFGGQCLAGLLTRGALDDVRAPGLHVVPYCP